jgi:hypothetical protein
MCASASRFKLGLGVNERIDDLSLIMGFMRFGDKWVDSSWLKKKKERVVGNVAN